ncbi:MAG: hypothetical protein EBR82_59900, partial [Caulobacteraceae bacterium]|nr:hypothetical protein [Caulobacteraceae bacterium]
GSLYSSLGRSLGLTGEGGLFSGVGKSITSTYQNIAATPLWSYGDLTGATNSALGAMPNGMYGPATESAVAAQGAGVGTLGQVAGGAAGVMGGAYGIYSGIQKGGVGGGFQVAGGALTAAAGVSSLLASAGIISASLGPVGWIAGAVLAIIGALLPGQKPSNMEGNATYDFATDSTVIGGQTGKKYSQGNRDAAASMIGGVVDVASRLERTLGITFNQKVAIGVGNRDGIYYRVNDGAAARYGRSDQGAQDLARDLVHEITVQSAGQIPNAAVRIPIQSGVKWDSLSGALQQIQQVLDTTNNGRPSASQNIAAEHIDWRDFGNGLADLKWVKDTYDTLTASQLPADKFARAVQQLNDQFDAAAAKAAQLGLSEAAVNAARARQLQGLTDQRDLEGLKLVASQQNTLTSFLDNLTYQNASPAERLSLAQGAFGQALEAARGGDIRTADLSMVTKSAATLLQAGQAYYGTGGGAADLERFVRSSIESLGAQLNLPAFGGDLEASLSAAVNPLKDELQLLRDEVAGLSAAPVQAQTNEPSVWLAEIGAAAASAGSGPAPVALLPLAMAPIGAPDRPADLTATLPIVRVSDRGWIGEPGDSLAPNTPYAARLAEPPAIERNLPLYPDTSRRLALTAGELRLVNGDGALDALAGDWSVAGRRVVLRRGPHRRPLHAPLTEFSQVADLRAAGAASGTTRLAVPLRPAAVELDVPVCGLYLGTGGMEGPSTLAGQFKPRLYGLKRNVEPVLIDAGLLLYQLHDGPLQQVLAVRDKGVALTAGGDVASYAALASTTVASGTYKTCLVAGLVRVGATPSLLTADARGDNDASTGGYNTGSAASIAQKLL